MNILMNPNIRFGYAGLFRSEREWIHPERTEVTYEIIYVTRGEVWLREGETEYHLQKGQLIVLTPNVCHVGSRPSTDVGFYWVHFSVSEGELPFSQRLFDRFEHAYLLKELLHYNNLPNAPTYLVNAVLLHILSELCRLSGGHTPSYDERAEKIYEWIRINADAALSVGKVAAHFGYSADHLSRICKSSFGVGARALIDRFLLARAKELLCNTDLYVKEIAAELSFSDDKAFLGFFKYHEGCFPTEFRERFARLHMNSK